MPIIFHRGSYEQLCSVVFTSFVEIYKRKLVVQWIFDDEDFDFNALFTNKTKIICSFF